LVAVKKLAPLRETAQFCELKSSKKPEKVPGKVAWFMQFGMLKL